MKKTFYQPFLIFLTLLSLVGIYFLFRPFIIEIIIATVLVSIFYPLYQRLVKLLWNKKYLSSFLLCLILLVIIIIPASKLIVIASKKASSAYSGVNEFLLKADDLQYGFLERVFDDLGEQEIIIGFVNDMVKSINDWLLSGASFLVKETGKLVFSLGIIIITMLFFFVEGEKILQKIILWSPLPNKYDLVIINKFRRVSRTILLSIFVSALVQGLLGGIGFALIGWPFVFTFIIMALLSLIPYIGSSIFYVPAAFYLILSGQIWSGIFIFLWSWLVVSNLNEILRAYLVKNKTEVNPIFIIFSILGGISIFGFWGVVLGPLIIALTVTILHIYELEYQETLER